MKIALVESTVFFNSNCLFFPNFVFVYDVVLPLNLLCLVQYHETHNLEQHRESVIYYGETVTQRIQNTA